MNYLFNLIRGFLYPNFLKEILFFATLTCLSASALVLNTLITPVLPDGVVYTTKYFFDFNTINNIKHNNYLNVLEKEVRTAGGRER